MSAPIYCLVTDDVYRLLRGRGVDNFITQTNARIKKAIAEAWSSGKLRGPA